MSESKTYISELNKRQARPRSKRLRELGAGGAGSTVVLGGGSLGAGHTHDNKKYLDQLTTDEDDYLYLTQTRETTDPDTGESVNERQTNKVKAGHADTAHDLDEDTPANDRYLRKDQDDRTPHNLNIGGALNVGGTATFEGNTNTVGNAYVGKLLTVGEGVVIGGSLLNFDAVNKALRVTHPDGSTDTIGLYAEGWVSAKGANGSLSGGGGSASALYQLVDVVTNSTNDGVLGAATGKVLMYNGTKWEAGSVVTDISALTLQVNGTTLATFDGKSNIVANIPVPTRLSHLTDDILSGKYLPLTGGTISGALTVNNGLYGKAYGSNPMSFFNGYMFHYNVDSSSTSEYDFGIYQWQDNLRVTYRSSADNSFKGIAFYVSGEDGQTVFTMTPKVGATKLSLEGHTHDYLPLTGGTVSGNITFKSGTIIKRMPRDTSNYETGICFYNSDGSTKLAEMGYHNTVKRVFINPNGSPEIYSDAVGKYSLVIGENLLTWNTYPILRTDNYGSYAVTLDTAQTITGVKTFATSIKIGDCTITYDSTNKGLRFSTGIYSDSYVSAKGIGSSSGGGSGASALYQLNDVAANGTNDGVLGAATGKVLMYNGTKWEAGSVVTDISTLTLQVNGITLATYNGKDNVVANIPVPTRVSHLTNDSGYIKGITKAMVEGVLTGNITSHTHSYLPLTGGTMAGNITMGSSYYIFGINETGGAILQFDGSKTVIGSVGDSTTAATAIRSKTGHVTCGTTGTQYTMLDSDNYNSYAPTKTGSGASGTWGISITGNAATATDANTLEGYHKADILRITKNPTATYSLNDSVVSNGIDLTSWALAYSSYVNDQPAGDGATSAASVVSFGGTYPFQLYSDYTNTSKLYYRSYYSGNGWKTWRQFAFTDSNVASADKLHTARTLWGQAFDGTANVSGPLTGVTNITASGTVTISGINERYIVYGNSGYGFHVPTTGGWTTGANVYDSSNTLMGYYAGAYGNFNTLYYYFFGGIYTSPLMVILPSGNVGIGNTSPTYKLDVTGSIRATDSITANSIKIGDCTITYDSVNKGLKLTTGLYSESYISAKGAGTSSGGSGGTSALYQLVDVKPNDANDGVYGASTGKALMYNGTKWEAMSVLTSINTLTLQVNGTTLATYNGKDNVVTNIAIPTKISQLTDDVLATRYLPLGGGSMTGQIRRDGVSTQWIKGRDNAMIRMSSLNAYSVLASLKTTNGTWEIGTYNNSAHTDDLLFTYCTDEDYNNGNNVTTAQIKFFEDGTIGASITGNADTASKWATARTLTLTGSVTGSVTMDGSGNVTLATTTNHTHTKAQITDFPTSLKNPYAITIQANGTSLGSYDGSSAKTINLTYSNVGAAAASHTHSYLPLSGGTMTGSITMSGAGTHIVCRMASDSSNYRQVPIWYSSDGATKLAEMGYHNTVKRIFINPNGSAEVWNDAEGKYSLVVGENLLTWNTYPILRTDNYGSYAVTLDTAQTITGVKTFATSIKIGDCTITYDSVNKGLRFSTGIYSDDYVSARGASSSSGGGGGASALYQLNDVAANSTNDGVLGASTGKVLMYNGTKWQAGSVVTDIATLTMQVNGTTLATFNGKSNVVANIAVPTKVSQLTNDSGYIKGITKAMVEGVLTGNITSHTHSYLPLTGGTMAGNITMGSSYYIFGINETGGAILQFDGSKTVIGSVGDSTTAATAIRSKTGHVTCGTTGTQYTMLDSGNYNSYAPTKTGTGASGTWGISITGNAATATNADKLDGLHNGEVTAKYFNYVAGGFDCDAPTATLHSDYTGSATIANQPSDWHYGQMFTIGRYGTLSNALSAQMMWDVRHGTTYAGRLWFRTKDSSTGWRGWAEVLTEQSGNAVSATKLQTARTLWGKSFDGTANVSGNLSSVASIYMTGNIFNGNNQTALSCSTSYTILGYGTSQAGLNTYVDGNIIYLRCGTSHTPAMTITEDGNVGIGTTSPACKLYVSGDMAATGGVTAKVSSSDIRLKKDIREYNALEIIRRHRSIKYHWNETAKANADVFNDDYWHFGLIAQEVEHDLPQMVSNVFGYYLVIQYERLLPIMWRGLQEVDSEIDKLKRRVKMLESTAANWQRRASKLEMELNEIRQNMN